MHCQKITIYCPFKTNKYFTIGVAYMGRTALYIYIRSIICIQTRAKRTSRSIKNSLNHFLTDYSKEKKG